MLSVSNRYIINMATTLSVVLLLLFLSFSLSGLLGNWPDSFTRPGKGIVYLFIYFGLLWCFLLFYSFRLLRWTITKQIIIGMIVGQFISMISVMITAQIFFSNPIERLINGIEQLGFELILSAVIIINFWRAILLGGWLFGLVSIPLLKMFKTQIERLLNPNASIK